MNIFSKLDCNIELKSNFMRSTISQPEPTACRCGNDRIIKQTVLYFGFGFGKSFAILAETERDS